MEWKKIKRDYVRGSASLKALSDKYKVPYGTLRKKAAAEGWTELRNIKRTKAEQMVIDAAAKMEADRFSRIVGVADKMLDKLAALVDSKDFESKFTDADSKQNIKALTGALKDLKDITGAKTKREIDEQEARIESLRRSAANNDADREITVSFVNVNEDYRK